ncbi:MAG: hypothetical protein NXI22_10075 [bacterium]|nr:hypothetical protein [bacterium]
MTLKTAIACDAVTEWDQNMKRGFYEDARAAIVSRAAEICETFGKEEFEKMWWATIESDYDLT